MCVTACRSTHGYAHDIQSPVAEILLKPDDGH